MMAYRAVVLVVSTVCLAAAQLNPPLRTPPDSTRLGLNINRSLRLLSTNQAIRIVTAGQSIIDVNNQWHYRLMDSLRTKFGNTRLTHIPRGVGACATDCQLANHVGTIAADNPDLVIYYVYGWENYDRILYEIHRLCPNDSLEFLILNDHITPPTSDIHARTYSEYMNRYFLPWMCEKWKAGLCDIRTPWAQYLADYGYAPSQVLADDVHLNAHGQWLMEDLVERYFVIRGPDRTAPLIDSVTSISPTRVKIRFNEKIERSSALVASNYIVEGTTVSGVVFGGDLQSVFISTPPRAAGQQYTVRVNGVRDLAGNAVSNVSASFVSTADVGWRSVDIGMCASPGSTTMNESAGTWTLRSTADNTWAYKNEYHYSYKTVYGDFELTARLASHGASPSQQNAMAGLCIREVPEYYARCVGVGIRSSGALTYLLRENERDTLVVRSGVNRTVPQWFRIRRSGNTITMQYSSDGTGWQSAPTTTWLTTYEVTVGLFALAGNYASTETANFTNVVLTGGTVPVAQPVSAAQPKAVFCSAVRRLGGDRILAISDTDEAARDVEVFDVFGRCVVRAPVIGPHTRLALPGTVSPAFVRIRGVNGETRVASVAWQAGR